MRRFPKRTRIRVLPGCEPRLVSHDRDFVAEPVAGHQGKRVAAPERAGIKPVVALFGREQAHLLVGDGDGLSTIRGFQPDLEFLRLPAPSDLTNLAVHERNSLREVADGKAAAEPAAGET